MSNKTHKQLLAHLEPLIDFMDKNGHSYFLVAGKYGVCARYLLGNNTDLIGMLTGMAENNECVKKILIEAVNELNKKSIKKEDSNQGKFQQKETFDMKLEFAKNKGFKNLAEAFAKMGKINFEKEFKEIL